MPRLARPLFAALALAALSGCGVSYQPSRSANFEIDSEAEIDDDDIRKAFEARPQMPKSEMRVAYYTFDPEIVADLEQTIHAVPGVTTVYRIPPLLVTGQRRLADEYSYGPTPQVSVKKLRLLAARANTDVLVIADHGYRNQGVNALAGLNMLLVTLLFVPFLDTRVKGYAEAFVIDVRNGYLYGHLIEEDERGESYATIYAKSARDHAKEQWWDLRKGLQKDLNKLVEEERAASGKKTAPAATAAPTTAPDAPKEAPAPAH